MTFDPESDGWGLREACMRTAIPSMMAQLHRHMIEAAEAGIAYEEPSWWIYKLAPPPWPAPEQPRSIERMCIPHEGRRWLPLTGAIENHFEIKLAKGELVCWARPAAPHESHVKLGTSAWSSLRIEDWVCGSLITCAFDARRRFVPVAGGMRYYSARIEPPDANSSGRPQDRPGRAQTTASAPEPPQAKWPGYNDAPLVEEMKRLVNDDIVQSSWEAARAVAPRAKGGGTEASKAKRLHAKYSRS